ncbi:hypothetical protein LINPERPRIM_LOCUS30924, partial [Linum perenne]
QVLYSDYCVLGGYYHMCYKYMMITVAWFFWGSKRITTLCDDFFVFGG